MGLDRSIAVCCSPQTLLELAVLKRRVPAAEDSWPSVAPAEMSSQKINRGRRTTDRPSPARNS